MRTLRHGRQALPAWEHMPGANIAGLLDCVFEGSSILVRGGFSLNEGKGIDPRKKHRLRILSSADS